jgi:hypothetical protein
VATARADGEFAAAAAGVGVGVGAGGGGAADSFGAVAAPDTDAVDNEAAVPAGTGESGESGGLVAGGGGSLAPGSALTGIGETIGAVGFRTGKSFDFVGDALGDFAGGGGAVAAGLSFRTLLVAAGDPAAASPPAAGR